MGKRPSDLTATSYKKYTEARKESTGGNMSGFDMRDDETYSEYKSRKLREKGPGFHVAMGQKRYNPDDPAKSEADRELVVIETKAEENKTLLEKN